mmetsp:Transcript_2307/g.8843  ORF Transcript_2307/g.8843 Transcript_2307/m.8843 type:complete len:218 (+) Transcript_2307:2171-2824(+)
MKARHAKVRTMTSEPRKRRTAPRSPPLDRAQRQATTSYSRQARVLRTGNAVNTVSLNASSASCTGAALNTHTSPLSSRAARPFFFVSRLARRLLADDRSAFQSVSACCADMMASLSDETKPQPLMRARTRAVAADPSARSTAGSMVRRRNASGVPIARNTNTGTWCERMSRAPRAREKGTTPAARQRRSQAYARNTARSSLVMVASVAKLDAEELPV